MSQVEATGPLKNMNVKYANGDFKWGWGTCPRCGLRGRIDEDQYKGEVSVDCPGCPYHATHDHREES